PQPVVAELRPAATQQKGNYRVGEKMLQLVRVLEAHHRDIDGRPEAADPYQRDNDDGEDAPVGGGKVFEERHQVSFPFRVNASVTMPASRWQCHRKLRRSSSPDAPPRRVSACRRA